MSRRTVRAERTKRRKALRKTDKLIPQVWSEGVERYTCNRKHGGREIFARLITVKGVTKIICNSDETHTRKLRRK